MKFQKMNSQGDKKNLKKITTLITKLFWDQQEKEFTLEQVSSILDIDKRKIYDLVNVLHTIHLIVKMTKGVYKWNNLSNCHETLNMIPKPE